MGATAKGIRAGRAFVELFADDTKLQAVLKRTQVRMLSLSDFIRTVGLRMASGSALLSVPIIKATSDYVKFSDQMLEVAGITSATNKQLDQLTRTARRLAMQRGTSFLAQDIGALMSELGRAGFATDEINKMTRSVLLLARASKTDVALSAKITGSTMRQFKKDTSEAGHVADLLAKTANASATSVESLGAALEYAGLPVDQLGHSLERTLASIGVMGNLGIVGTEAGTALRRLATMSAADAMRIGQIFGVAFRDARGGALPLVDILEKVDKATKNLGSADRLKKYHDAFGILGITSSIAVGQTAGSIRELERELQNVTGYAERAAKAMDSGIGGSLRVSWAALKDFGLSIGTVLDKHLVPIIDKVGVAFKTLSDFTMKNPQVIVDIAKGVAGIGAAGVSLMAIGTAGGLAALNLRGIGYALHFALTPARALSAALSGVLGVIAKTNRMGTSLAGVLMSSVSLPGLSSLSSGRGKGRGKSYAKAQSRKGAAAGFQQMAAGVSAGGSQMMAGFGSLRNVVTRPSQPVVATPQSSSVPPIAPVQQPSVASSSQPIAKTAKVPLIKRMAASIGLVPPITPVQQSSEEAASPSKAPKAARGKRAVPAAGLDWFDSMGMGGPPAAAPASRWKMPRMPAISFAPLSNWWGQVSASVAAVSSRVRPANFIGKLSTKGFDNIVDAMANFEAAAGRSFVRGVNVLPTKNRAAKWGGLIRGSFSRQNRNVGLNPKEATVETGMHEMGHAVDLSVGGGHKKGYASEQGKGLIGRLMPGLRSLAGMSAVNADSLRQSRLASERAEIAQAQGMLSRLLPEIDQTNKKKDPIKWGMLIRRKRELRGRVAELSDPARQARNREERAQRSQAEYQQRPREVFARFFAKQSLPVQVALSKEGGPRLRDQVVAAFKKPFSVSIEFARRLPGMAKSGLMAGIGYMSSAATMARDVAVMGLLRAEAVLMRAQWAGMRLGVAAYNAIVRGAIAVQSLWRASYAGAMAGLASSRVVIAGLRTSMIGLAMAPKLMGAGMWALNAAMVGMAGTMATAKVGLLGMGVAFKAAWLGGGMLLSGGFGLLKSAATASFPYIVAGISSVGSMLLRGVKALPAFIGGLYQVGAGALKASLSIGRLVALKGFAGLVTGASMLLTPMGLIAAGAVVVAANWGRISGAVRSVVASAPGQLSGMWARIRGDALPTLSGIRDTALRSFGAIREAVQAGDIPAAMSILWSGIRTIWAEGFGYLRMKWFDVTTWASDAFTGVLQVAATSAASITNTLDLALFDWFGVRLHDVTGAFSTAWDWIASSATSSVTWIQEKWRGFFGGFGDDAVGIGDVLFHVFESWRKSATKSIVWVSEIFPNAFASAVDQVSDMISSIPGIGFMAKKVIQDDPELAALFAKEDEARKRLKDRRNNAPSMNDRFKEIDKDYEARADKRTELKRSVKLGEDPAANARIEAARKRVEELEAKRKNARGADADARQKLAKELDAKLAIEKENLSILIRQTAEKRKQAQEEADAKANEANGPKTAAKLTGPQMPEGLTAKQQRSWQLKERIRQREEAVAEKKKAAEEKRNAKKPKSKGPRVDWQAMMDGINWEEEMPRQAERQRLIDEDAKKVKAEKARRKREELGLGPAFMEDGPARGINSDPHHPDNVRDAFERKQKEKIERESRKSEESRRFPDLASAKADLKSRIPDLQAMRMASLGGAGKASPTPGSQITIDQGAVIAKLEETHRDDARYYVGIIDALREMKGRVTA